MAENSFKTLIVITLVTLLFLFGTYFLIASKETVNNQHSAENKISKEHLLSLPLKTPKDRIERLNYVEKEGVKEFQLSTDEIRWEYAKGKFVHAWSYNSQISGPEIRVTEGDKIRIIVKNNLPVATSIHWHGVHVENKADGVPGLTQNAIKPKETFIYEFTAKNAGTHFYHAHGSSHTDAVVQMNMGLSGAFIIEPKNPMKYDREYIYMLDEWAIASDSANQILETLEQGEHIHNTNKQLNYNVFTINGRIFPDIEPLKVKEGEKILIRLINAGTQEIHPMHTHGHSFRVVAVDGNPIPKDAQLTRDNLPVLPGERYDIELVANNPGVWLFHCHHVHHASAGMIIPLFYEGYKPLV